MDAMIGGDLILMAKLDRDKADELERREMPVEAKRFREAAWLQEEAAAWKRGDRDGTSSEVQRIKRETYGEV